jgi:hypothetical protein
MKADEINEIRRKINNLTSEHHEQHYRRNITIPIRRSSAAMNDELASVLPTIIDSTRECSYNVRQSSSDNQTNNNRRDSTSNYNMTDSRRGSQATESRRNSNILQDFMKEVRQTIEYDDDIDAFENDDNNENKKIDVQSCEDHDNEEEVDGDNTMKSGCGRKSLFLKQLKKMLCKSCSIGLKASVLLLGHILLSIFKVLAFI